MALRIAAVLALLAIAGPANAQESVCLAAPTRECVFRLVVDRAETDGDHLALLYAAAWQETLGMEEAEATAARAVAALRKWDADPAVIAFNFALIPALAVQFDNRVLRVLGVAARVAEAFTAQMKARDVPPNGYLGLSAFFFGLAGDRDQVRLAIQAVGQEERVGAVRAAALGLLLFGDAAGAAALAELVPEVDLAEDLKVLRAKAFLFMGQLDEAVAAAATVDDSDDQAEALVEIALRLAAEGKVEDAVGLVTRPAVLRRLKVRWDWEFTPDVALVHAYAGDVERVELLLRVNRRGFPRLARDTGLPGGGDREFSKHRLIAALMAGHEETALAMLDRAEDLGLGYFQKSEAFAAYLASGPNDIAAFLERLSEGDLADALVLLASQQADHDEVDAALATLERVRAIASDDGPAKSIARDLAPALARAGRGREAVAMAEAAGDLIALAAVAASIE